MGAASIVKATGFAIRYAGCKDRTASAEGRADGSAVRHRARTRRPRGRLRRRPARSWTRCGRIGVSSRNKRRAGVISSSLARQILAHARLALRAGATPWEVCNVLSALANAAETRAADGREPDETEPARVYVHAVKAPSRA